MLARKRGILLRDLYDLTAGELLLEIAAFQWELVVETASSVHHWPEKKKRPTEIARLERSASPIDRYAAALIHQWERRD